MFLAPDAAAANAYILDLARERGVLLVAKSKSMTSEEIRLNQHLERGGVKVVETDLGEWIIQMAGERPSHMTMPALHKTREEVAELFSRQLGRPVPPDISVLVRLAREELRRSFLEAGMGISGANLALAQSGTLVIVSNEGNARLVTALPPVHVALVGMDKLVPGLKEAVPVLQSLAPGATGQLLTSYVSLITGPSRTADIENALTLGVHGPEEVHIVLLDNGRTRLREDGEFREALYCIRCAACLNLCPVFQMLGGHTFGHIYVGGIGAILTAFYHGLEASEDAAQLCMVCGACTEVCPAGIDIPRMVVALRSRLAAKKGMPWLEGLFLHHILPHPRRFHSVARLASRLSHSPLAPGLAGLAGAGLPHPAPTPLRERLGQAKEGKVSFYAGCLIDSFYPEIGEAVVGVLSRQGIEVRFPGDQRCCGIPALYNGDRETAAELARHNIAALEEGQQERVITACPTCALALTREYPRLLDGEWQERARRLAERVRDFSWFLREELRLEAFPSSQGGVPVTYHDPCHLKWGLGIERQPRELLHQAGYQVVEMASPDRCCGFAGTYSLSFPGIAHRLREDKAAEVRATGARVVATDCPGCLLHLRAGLAGENPVEVRHTAELLFSALNTP